MLNKMFTVNFKLCPELKKELNLLREVDASTRALIVTMNNELMQLHCEPLEATSNMADDFQRLRDVIVADNVGAAYVILRLDVGKFAQVTFCSDALKPKEKMLYASGAGHLADALESVSVVKKQVGCVDDITPLLFEKPTTDKQLECMTESERLRAEIDKMEVAPMPVILPGVAVSFGERGAAALGRFCEGEIVAVVFALEGDTITAENTFDFGNEATFSLSSFIKVVGAVLPKDHPRFVVICWPLQELGAEPEGKQKEKSTVMVYVCPAACKPREKMAYASSKSSFLSQAEKEGTKFARKLELGDVDEFYSALLDAFSCDTGAKE